MVKNESKTELAQNIVRQQIANSRYFLFCDLSVLLLSDAIIADADEKTKKAGIKRMFEKINGRLDTTEEKISELEHESLEVNQTEAQREGKTSLSDI